MVRTRLEPGRHLPPGRRAGYTAPHGTRQPSRDRRRDEPDQSQLAGVDRQRRHTGYQVERCQGASCTSFTQVATSTGTTYNDTGLTAGTSYSYRVRAVDAAANQSAYSTVATATTTTPDIQPPTAPATLSATAVSGSQINLNWSGANDNGVTGTRWSAVRGQADLFADCVPERNDLQRHRADAGTSYSYRVRATDAAGNFGPYSPIASAVTTAPDTQPPTAPATVVATAVSAAQMNVSWSAATDNVGVTGYRLERCQGTLCATFTPLASPSGMSYSDMGLAPSTSYSYRVFAVDAAGNNGPYSPVATTTTQLGPSGLVAAYGFNEGSGTTTADASGNGLTGTLNGAAWTTLGPAATHCPSTARATTSTSATRRRSS